jgi:hypothetical protein
MEAWVWPASTASGRAAVISTDNGSYDWSILRQGNLWILFTGNNAVRTGFEVEEGRWQHVAAVFDGETARFYLNGQPSEEHRVSFETNTAELWIGQSPGYRQGFEGRIDEVRIWSRPLSHAEIVANASEAPSGSTHGLLAYWTFEGVSGSKVRDSSRHGHHATLVAGASVSGTDTSSAPAHDAVRPTEQYLELDGSSGYVATELRIPQDGPTARWTLEAWAWPASTSNGRHHVVSTDNRGYDWSILRQHDSWLVFTGQNAVNTGLKVRPKQWQHLAAVFDGDHVVLYLNGKPSQAFPIGFESSVESLHIGRNPAFPELFDGYIDDVRVWNTVRSAHEIRTNMNRELGGNEAGLVGYWKLNSSDNGITPDSSSRRNHGSLHGAVVVGSEPAADVARTLQRGRGTTRRP